MKKQKKHRITDEAICDAAHQAIRQAGWRIPTDEESVATAEARLANDMPELPPSLMNPEFPSDAGNASAGKVVPLWDSAIISEPMARAARQGGSVSPEIEEVMKRDRKIAEQKMQERSKDPDEDPNKDRENDDR